jgi:hypothetical protein
VMFTTLPAIEQGNERLAENGPVAVFLKTTTCELRR